MAAALLAATTLLGTSVALADPTHYPGRGGYVFANEAFNADASSKNPINFIFQNKNYIGDQYLAPRTNDVGSCNFIVQYYRCRAQIRLENDWNGHGLAPRYNGAGTWYNHRASDGPDAVGNDDICANKDPYYLDFRPPPHSSFGGVLQPFQGSGSTSSNCIPNQYHARFWTDQVVAAEGGTGLPAGWFIAGSIHHDKLQLAVCDTPVPHPCAHHTLTESWNQTRDVLLIGMRNHCEQPHWGLAYNAPHFADGEPFDGVVARLSTAYKSNCNQG